ncbi:MAG: hypothetical protein R3320_13140 [Nitriliruptorales bacterium]|nr:hypothetical protein [Nitriliruptorales bacterium]
MSRRMILITLGVLALVVVTGMAMAQTGGIKILSGDSAGSSTDERSTSDVVHSTEDPDDVARYWTEERMRDAEPVPMPNPTTSGDEVQPGADGHSDGGTSSGQPPSGASGSDDAGGSEAAEAEGYEPAPMPNPTVSE